MTREYCQPHFTRLQEQMYLSICFNYGMTWDNPFFICFIYGMAWGNAKKQVVMTREYCQPHFTWLQEQMYLFICFNYGMTWGDPYLFALFMA